MPGPRVVGGPPQGESFGGAATKALATVLDALNAAEQVKVLKQQIETNAATADKQISANLLYNMYDKMAQEHPGGYLGASNALKESFRETFNHVAPGLGDRYAADIDNEVAAGNFSGESIYRMWTRGVAPQEALQSQPQQESSQPIGPSPEEQGPEWQMPQKPTISSSIPNQPSRVGQPQIREMIETGDLEGADYTPNPPIAKTQPTFPPPKETPSFSMSIGPITSGKTATVAKAATNLANAIGTSPDSVVKSRLDELRRAKAAGATIEQQIKTMAERVPVIQDLITKNPDAFVLSCARS